MSNASTAERPLGIDRLLLRVGAADRFRSGQSRLDIALDKTVDREMKPLLIAAFLLLVTRGFSADGVPAFQAGLQAFQANGPDALLNTWYNLDKEADKLARLRADLTQVTRGLGPVVETQVFAPRDLGRHVQRLYGVIYFERRPLWIRAEYYAIGGRAGFLSLEYSLSADDILPLTFAEPTSTR